MNRRSSLASSAAFARVAAACRPPERAPVHIYREGQWVPATDGLKSVRNGDIFAMRLPTGEHLATSSEGLNYVAEGPSVGIATGDGRGVVNNEGALVGGCECDWYPSLVEALEAIRDAA